MFDRGSGSYEATYERMLGDVAAASNPHTPLTPFWPLRGRAYNGALLVLGRSVNGWIDDWTARELGESPKCAAVVAFMRADASPADRCRMAWVTDLWDARTGYATRRSAFWRVLRLLVVEAGLADEDHWASALVWSNLYKVAPAVGWNPGADLQRAQRAAAGELLRLELDAFAPRRVLAMTGASWIAPFASGLGLRLEPGAGFVDGVGRVGATTWVVAQHPMTKPQSTFVADVRAAFADAGASLDGRGSG